MEKIFEHANEQHLRAGVVYYKAADSLLYFDSAFKKVVSAKELINLFNKGVLVVNDGTNFVRPTVLTISDNYACVKHTTVGELNVAVSTAFYSEGYSAT